MFEYVLEWHPFSVKLDRMHKFLKENCSDYDGMVASDENLKVMLTFYNEADIIKIDDYWESLTEATESQPTQEELKGSLQDVVKGAITFGQELIVSFAAENILMGITQAGRTKDVADYLADVLRYAQSGSLYEVINEVDRLVTAGIPQDLAPFVTAERMESFKQQIIEYLS